MVWFYCDDCGDSIKKPKLVGHFRTCRGQTFTCVDCSRVFDRSSAAGHSTCVSEHEKYALGATKPGGFAAQGFFEEGQSQPQQQGAAHGSQEIVGAQFLSERPPWKCSCCNVNCTSRDTLLGHAAGVKHKRRARAALGISGQQQQASSAAAAAQQPDQQAVAAGSPVAGADAPVQLVGKPGTLDTAVPTQQAEPASKTQHKDKKAKKHKSSKQQNSTLEAAAAQGASEAEAVNGKVVDNKPSSKGLKKQRKALAAGVSAAEVEPITPAAAIASKRQEGSHVELPKDKSSTKHKKHKHRQQQNLPDLAPLLAVAHKKLKKKGKLRLKKLEVLMRENANGGFSQDMVAAVKGQLLAAAEVKLQGKDTLVWAD